ncbi:MAG: response regulator transcription factor [Clostridiales Family XIII bacterium]|jgi:DNA-binding response OmpR family regulator|nr:response regulator transcription factor [Clostridiales Family XIII bacterium]
MGYRILVAEDDEDIVNLLTLYLENEGWTVISACNGTDALALAQDGHIDLAILDIMMPGLNGYELTRKLRAASNMPILILSAKGRESDRILGLDMGADDYMAKPFNPLEIVARVRANLRRYYKLGGVVSTDNGILAVGGLTLNLQAMSVSCDGADVVMTPTEFKILSQLMSQPGRVFTKVQLYENVNGKWFESDDNTMMVHISKMREKIEKDPRNPRYIHTVRGLGYKVEDKG